jgi:hypothetical protein
MFSCHRPGEKVNHFGIPKKESMQRVFPLRAKNQNRRLQTTSSKFPEPLARPSSKMAG